MKHFKAMVKRVREDPKALASGQFLDQPAALNLFWEAVPQNEIFVFAYAPGAEPQELLPDEQEEKLDAPFKVFSIEMGGDAYITVPEPGDAYRAFVLAAMVVENNPLAQPELGSGVIFLYTKLEVPALGKLFGQGDDKYAVLCMGLDSDDARYRNLVRSYLDRLHSHKDGVEEVDDVVFLPAENNKGKKPHKIRRVFHVVPNKIVKSYSSDSKRPVNWTHQWSVRGHWMNFRLSDGSPDISKVGKDRDGNRSEMGRTWRVAYVKGPKDAPLVKKVRVVNVPDDSVDDDT